jgi:hypothetical protein
MKKLMSVLLGLSLLAGTAAIGFAAAPPDPHGKQPPQKGDPTKKEKKLKKLPDSPR